MRRTCLDAIHRLARADERVVFIGSDLGPGTLDAMREEMPERFFMEGVAEQNVVGTAAGMALEGFVPYVNTIATFLTRRCLEQTALDACLHDAPVRLVANGGGLVYAPLGPTHCAIEDLALMRALPNMTVLAPADANEMARLMPATVDHPGPLYIRLAKGGDRLVTRDEVPAAIGPAVPYGDPGDVCLVTTGVMLQRALEAAEILEADGITAGIVHCPTVKPLDTATLADHARHTRLLVTVEEHVVNGGLGTAVLETLTGGPPLKRLGLPHRFVENYGNQEGLLERLGLTAEGIAGAVRRELAERA